MNNPSKIVALTTMSNFRPRPRASVAATFCSERRDPRRYNANPFYVLARALGVQRYSTALMLMETAAALPEQVKTQITSLLNVQNLMEHLYDEWQYHGAKYRVSDVSEIRAIETLFKNYKKGTKTVISLLKQFDGDGNLSGFSTKLKKLVASQQMVVAMVDEMVTPAFVRRLRTPRKDLV